MEIALRSTSSRTLRLHLLLAALVMGGALVALGATSTEASAPSCNPATTTSGLHVYAAFTTTGPACDWNLPAGIGTFEALVVGGGGGGGVRHGGGGGGGGFLETTATASPGATLTITVGDGGAGGAYGGTPGNPPGLRGEDSTVVSGVLSLQALGGGGGNGGDGVAAGAPFGSGGGGRGDTAGLAGTSGQGNSGGSGLASSCTPGTWCGGGGGGAGGAGAAPAAGPGTGGAGGAGRATTLFDATIAQALSLPGEVFAGGGGGGGTSAGGPGGTGGGADGSIATSSAPAGVDGLGGGGGGTGYSGSASGNAGDGGSGVVVLRVQAARSLVATTAPSASAVTGVAFPDQPVLELRDENGAVLSGDSSTQVTVTHSGVGVLSGTTTVTAVNGVVTFTDLVITSTVAGSATLTFTSDTLQPLVTTAMVAVTLPTCPPGVERSAGAYTYWVVTDPGTCEVTLPAWADSFDALVVGGGGGGGVRHGGGGGGGGSIESIAEQVPAGATLTITVGDGGAGGQYADGVAAGQFDPGPAGRRGSDSTVIGGSVPLQAFGGGGGSGSQERGADGGSGGGGSANVHPGRPGTAGQGHAGGNASQGGCGNGKWCGGGGGGAGGVGRGGNDPSASGGTGGPGRAATLFDAATATTLGLPGHVFAGGGGGGAGEDRTGGAGGSGGGGAGSNFANHATAGTDGLGGGGGGSGYREVGDPKSGNGGDGGSGVVVIRVQAARSLAATTPPDPSAVSDAPLPVQPVLELRDDGGARLSGDDLTQVTVTHSGVGVLSGTTTVTAVNGVVTFSDLEITSTAAGSATLTFTSDTLQPLVTTATVNVQMPACPSTARGASGAFNFWVFKDAGGCTFTAPAGLSALEHALVAGGGGGGGGTGFDGGAGGGGGGVLVGSSAVTGGDGYDVVVGFGGAGGPWGGPGTDGSQSVFDSFVAVGGGGGGGGDVNNGAGRAGGSGGGGARGSAGGAGTPGQGAAGGNTGGRGPAGGGGAWGSGWNASLDGGHGGAGGEIAWITPTLADQWGIGAQDGTGGDAGKVWFSGGGGGSHVNGVQFAANGGRGGGGDGGGNSRSGARPVEGAGALARTGGGGGGGDGARGGAGGSAVVVLRAQTLQTLRIVTPPAATGVSGSALTTQPVLELVDLDGNVATSDSSTQVTVTVSSDGRLDGTATVAAVNGVVRFTDLGIRNWQTESLTLTFTTDSPWPLVTTATVNVTLPACSASAQTSDAFYTYWVFAEYGGCTWTAPAGLSALEHALVAGGGGGGGGNADSSGAGGGGGGILVGPSIVTGGGDYAVVVGFGGSGGPAGGPGADGFRSVFDSSVAVGGGGGGAASNGAGRSGGSGGGGARSAAGGAGMSGQGEAGGNANGPGPGGGGGAWGSGWNASLNGGHGGAGGEVAWITPTLADQWGIGAQDGTGGDAGKVWFSGGGGAAHYVNRQFAANGGRGGGGDGGGNSASGLRPVEGADALPRTGGGGGGGEGARGGAGASGVVVLRANTLQALTITTMPVGPVSSGALLATQPVLELRDLNGGIARADSSTQVRVTATSGWTLGGTTTITVDGGIARFEDLTLAGAVGTDVTLTFSIVTPAGVYTLTEAAFVQVAPGMCEFDDPDTVAVESLNERHVVGTYTYWTFREVGGCRWESPDALGALDYLVAAGGGGGGGENGGGGGAGGLLTGTTTADGGTEYAVAVGAGGSGGTTTQPGGDGFRSAFDALVAAGGGGGASGSGNAGRDGGSGGGGGPGGAAGVSAPGQGAAGGTGRDAAGGGGGAWGAGTDGATGSNVDGGFGGPGGTVAWLTPTLAGTFGVGALDGVGADASTVWFAGGGGGGHRFGEQYAATGGRGGGGDGGGNPNPSVSRPQQPDGFDGLASTGGGGGGGDAGSNGGAGGSGVIVLRAQTVQGIALTVRPVGPAVNGDVLLTQPVLELRDIDGRLTSDALSVTLTASSPSGQTLGCTDGTTDCLTQVADDGTVTFDAVKLTGSSGENITFTFTTVGLDQPLSTTAVVRVAPTPCPTSARTSDDDYTYWTITTPGNCLWTAPDALDAVDYLVVAGGGGGGLWGGGGAGGLLTGDASITPSGSLSITVGLGGSGGTPSNGGSNGGFSAFGPFVADGGGGGATSGAGSSGGSGGGGSFWAAGGASGAGQGSRGGAGSISPGGGGGAGAAGSSPPGSRYGNHGFGGVGRSIPWITADLGVGQLVAGSYHFAGGGGAAGVFNVRNPGAGGAGGGARGSYGDIGIANTGGGGGGTTSGGTAGGSGVVVVRAQTLVGLELQTMPIGPEASGDPFQQQPVLVLRDLDGNVAGGDSVTEVAVTLTTPSGTLAGTTTATASNGVVTFSDLELTGVPGSYGLRFATTNVPDELAVSVTVQVDPAPCPGPVSTGDPHYTYWVVSTVGECLWTAPDLVEATEYLVVGGGGGGGAWHGGGGGGGGLHTGVRPVVGGSAYAVAVGAGGAGGDAGAMDRSGEDGVRSAFDAIAAAGGGGGTWNGGRGGGRNVAGAGQGFAGGGGRDGAGGGGGAGGPGQLGSTGSSVFGGTGGPGAAVPWMTPSLADDLGVGAQDGVGADANTVWFGGGGGAGHRANEQYAADGGRGGGGDGGGNPPPPPRANQPQGFDGPATTGGGGGGGDALHDGGAGGSGVVVLRAQTLQALVWRASPVGPASSGAPLAAQPVLELRDLVDTLAGADSTTQVTVSAPVGWVLGGTTNVTAVNGVVTFSDLTLAGPIGTDLDLTFTTTNLPEQLTLAVTVQVAPAPCDPATARTTSGAYTFWTLTDVGGCVWTAPSALDDIDYLVVAGGGGGARHGGGGAGGLRTGTFPVTAGATYGVSVGAGGPGGLPSGAGTDGSSSSFGPIAAAGGGAGVSSGAGRPGGSGGGGAPGGSSGGLGNQPVTAPSQGSNGGIAWGTGGGGGGAGGAGQIGPFQRYTAGGNGGIGRTVPWIPGSLATSLGIGDVRPGSTVAYFAGGGGAGGINNYRNPGTGGLGGGGNGDEGGPGLAAAPNTGGGGGSGGTGGGDGGSGVVVFRHQTVLALRMATAPVGGSVGSALPTQPVFELLDADGNVVTTDSSTQVVATLTAGPVGAALTGTVTLTAVNGVISFTDLVLGNAPGSYTLGFATVGLPEQQFSVSAAVSLVSAAGDSVVLAAQPSATTMAGATFLSQPVVEIRDAFGNIVATGPDASATVTLSVSTGTGTLLGTTSVVATNGVATFSGLSMQVAGTGKVLTATAGLGVGVRTVDSTAFAIVPAPVDAATSTLTPLTGSIVADGTSTVTLTVRAKDVFGNDRTAGGDTVVISRASGTGTVGSVVDAGDGTYTAVVTAPTTVGAGSFSATIDGVAVEGGSGATAAAAIDFVAGVPAGYTVTLSAGSVVGGDPVTVTAQLVDANGNAVALAGRVITWGVSAAGGGSALSSPTATTDGAGRAQVVFTTSTVANDSVTLSANDAGGLSGTSGSVTSLVGPAAQLLVTPLGDQTAGTPFAVTVTLADANRNPVVNTGATGTVTLALGGGSGALGGTLTGTLAVGASALTIAGVELDVAQSGASITALGSGAGSDLVGLSGSGLPFRVLHGPAAGLEISTHPTSVVSGASFGASVTVVDAFGNTVTAADGAQAETVTLALSTGSGTLDGTVTATTVNGVATFSGLSIANAGTVSLGATAPSRTAATSQTFTVVAGAADASTSTVAVAPSTMPANGVGLATVTVTTRDAAGNARSSGGDTVVVTSTAGTVGTVVDNGDGTYTAPITAPSSAATATVGATIDGTTLTSTATLTFTATAPAVVEVVSGGGQSATVGTALSAPITVRVRDADGNPVDAETVTFTLTGGGTLAAATALTDASGVATVPTWTLGVSAGRQTLRASAGGGGAAVSTTVAATATPDVAVGFVATVSGSDAPLSGAGLRAGDPVGLRIAAVDANDNVDPTFTGAVTLTSTAFTGSVTATIATNGRVDGVSVTPTVAGSGLTIAAAASGISAATAATFPVAPGALASFDVTASGGTSAVGDQVSGAPFDVRVTARDAQGNVKTDFTGTVGLTSTAFAGSVTATIASGGQVDGVTLTPTVAGTARRVVATSGAVASPTASAAFAVSAGAPASLVVTTAPVPAASGAALAVQPVVEVRDAQGNVVTSAATITATVSATSGTPVLGGTLGVASSAGVATFTDLTLAGPVAATYTLTFSDGTRTASVTGLSLTGPGTATQLRLVTPASSSATTGTLLGTQPVVHVADAAGNVVATDSTTTVTVTIAGSGALTGPVTATAANGVVRFAGLGVDGADGASVTLTFAAGGGIADVSKTVTVSAGAVAGLEVGIDVPATVSIGTAITPSVTVALVDAYGNTVATAGTVVSASLVGATLTGATATTDASGVATFTSLTIVGAAGPAQLTFSSVGLSDTTSSPFTLAPAAQSITWAQPADLTFGAAQQQLAASATSGLPVSYTLGGGTTNGACTVSSTGVVSVVAIGSCEVVADQAGDGVFAPAPSVTRTIPVVPDTPGAPAISSVSIADGAVTVAFTPPASDGGATVSYTVTATPSGGGAAITLTGCTASPCTLSGLTNGTDYTVTVTATNSAGPGTVVTYGGASPTPVRPSSTALAVTQLTATGGDRSVTATWTAAQITGGAFDRYELFIRPSGGTFPSTPTHTLTSLADTSQVFTGLTNGTTYDIRIVTVLDNAGTGTADVTQTAATVPDAPANLTVSTTGPTSADVSFDVPARDGGAPLDATTPYTVTVTTVSPGAASVTCGTVVNRVCSLSGLTPGATYTVDVVATNRIGASNAATTTYAVPASAAFLTGLVVTDAAPGGANVALSPAFASGTTGYAATVASGVGAVTLTPTASSGATISVNRVTVASGSASGAVTIGTGASTIDVVVTAADGVTSETYEVTVTRAGPPTQLLVGTAAAAGASGSALTTQPVVRVAQASGVTDPTSTATVTVSASGGTLGCSGGGSACLSVQAVGGVARFADLTFAGSVSTSTTLTFTASGLSPVTMSVTPSGAGPAAGLAVTTEPPATVAAADPFTVAVAVVDAEGNVVTTDTSSVTLAKQSGLGSLAGTTTRTAVAGVARFTGLTLDRAGSVVLRATATAGQVDTRAIAVTVGAPDSIELVQATSGDLASGTSRTLTATIVDAAGNTVTSATGPVTFARTSGAGSVSGLATVPAVGGVATLVVAGATSGTLDVTVTTATLTSSPTSITVVPGAVLTVNLDVASADLTSGDPRTATVTLEDAAGNTVTGASGTIGLAATGSGALSGISGPVAVSAGGAAFSLAGTAAGTVSLTATFTPTSGTALTSTASTFTVVPGAVAQVTITGSTADLTAGDTRAIAVTLRDVAGNVVTGASGTLDLVQPNAAASGAGAVNGLGTLTVVAGSASASVVGDVAGTVTLAAEWSDGAVTRTSASLTLDVVPGAAASLALAVDTSSVAAGSSAVLTATIQDARGNAVRTASDQVTFTRSAGAGRAGGLGAVGATAGVATRTVTGAQAGVLQLTASTSTLTSAPVVLTVAAGTPAKVLLSGPTGTLAAGATRTLTATIADAADNPVTSSTATVTLTQASGSGSVTGLGSAQATAGVATFTVTGGLAGAVDVAAASTGLTASTPLAITVVAGPAAALEVVTAPSGAVHAAAASTQPVVRVVDAGGNPVARSGVIVTATITTGSGAVANASAVSDASGVATFSGLTLSGASGAKVLRFGATGLTATTSPVTLGKAPQSIGTVSGAPSGPAVGDAPFVLAATATSGLPVTFVSTTPAVCTTSGSDGSTVSIAAPGTCTVEATQAGGVSHDAASVVPTSVTVAKGTQAPLAITSATQVTAGSTLTLAAAGGTGSGAVTFTVSNASTCTVAGGTLTPGGVGTTCEVTATKQGGTAYTDVTSASVTVTVVKADRTLAFTSTVPTTVLTTGDVYVPTATLTDGATGTMTALPPTGFSIDAGTTSVCALTSGTVTFLADGVCTIHADAPGTPSANAPTRVSQSIAVGARNQTIMFAAPADVTVGDPDVRLVATADSGLPVVFSLATGTTSGACTVTSAGVVTIGVAGTCAVVADAPTGTVGGTTFAAASRVTRRFAVLPAAPGAPHIVSVSTGDQSATLSFTTPGTSGGATISGYRIVATPNGGGPSIVSTACTASPCTIGGLTNGTSYTFTLAAINSAGTGAATSPTPSVTPSAAAAAVRRLAATPGDTTLAVTWDPLTTAQLGSGTFSAYEVAHRPVGSGAAFTLCTPSTCSGSALTSRTTGATTIRGLTNGTDYEVRVVAYTSVNGSAAAGNTATVVEQPARVPSAPLSPSVLDLGSGAAVFTWAAPTSDGGVPLDATTPYTVTVTGQGAPITCTPVGTARRCSVTGLVAGRSYTFRVTAENALGTGAAATVSFTPPSVSSGSGGGSSGGSGGSSGGGGGTGGSGVTPPGVPGGTANPTVPGTPNTPGTPSIPGIPSTPGMPTAPGGPATPPVPAPTPPAPAPVPITLPPSVPPATSGGQSSSSNVIQGGAVVNGRPTPVPVVPVPARPGMTPNGATISGTTTSGSGSNASGTFSATVIGPSLSGPVGGGGLQVVPGQPLSIGASGFAPSSSVGVFAMPSGLQVGTLTTTPRGSLSGALPVPFAIPADSDALQLTGTAADGTSLNLALGMVVQAPAAPALGAGDVLPDPAATGVYVMVDRVPVPTEPVRDGGTLEVLERDATVEVSTRTGEGATPAVTADGVLVVTPEGSVAVEGTGMVDFVDVFVFSTPVYVGRIMVAEDGTFTGVLPLPDDLAPGEHTLQLVGLARTGEELAVSLPMRRVDDSQVVVEVGLTAEPPVTSLLSEPVVAAALGLAVALVILVSIRRLLGARRRRDDRDVESPDDAGQARG